jgi:hypothetical protein
MRWMLCSLAVCVLAALPAFCAPGDAARAYVGQLLDCLEAGERGLPQVTGAAETVAERLAAGGKLWLAGSYEGFVIEAYYRAGGMMNATRLKSADEPANGDVVLVGAIVPGHAADAQTLAAARNAGALAVLLAPEDLPGPHMYLSPHAPSGATAGGVPLVSPALTVKLWTFTGELVGALTRLGKMPPMFQSVVVPGGRERNEAHLGLAWEPETVPPVAAGELGGRYLTGLRSRLEKLRDTQMPLFGEAGRLAAQTLATGHTVWYVGVGHLPPYEPGQPGDPDLTAAMPNGIEADKAAEKVSAGDLVLYVGYYEPFGPWVEAIHGAGARIVTVLSGTPQRPAAEMGADINIDGCWPYGDALVQVPGYDVDILPPSGVVQAAAYWMLVAQIAAARGD